MAPAKTQMPEDPDKAMAWLEKLAENQTRPRPARNPSNAGQRQSLLLAVLIIAAIVVFVLLVVNLFNLL